jgi:hypothetical protein
MGRGYKKRRKAITIKHNPIIPTSNQLASARTASLHARIKAGRKKFNQYSKNKKSTSF